MSYSIVVYETVSYNEVSHVLSASEQILFGPICEKVLSVYYLGKVDGLSRNIQVNKHLARFV
jgi:hypothetical protein